MPAIGPSQREAPEAAGAAAAGVAGLAGSVAPLENDDYTKAFFLNPGLEVAELDLQLSQLFLVVDFLFHDPAQSKSSFRTSAT